MFAGLEDAFILADRLGHHSPFADGVAERLLAVDVLARLAGVDAGQIVPMLGRGVDDDVHVLAIQELPIVLIGIALVVGRPLVGASLVEVGYGDDVGVVGRFSDRKSVV